MFRRWLLGHGWDCSGFMDSYDDESTAEMNPATRFSLLVALCQPSPMFARSMIM